MNDRNFDHGPRLFFAGVPEAMRESVIAGARGEVAAVMQGNGIARYTSAELRQLVSADLAALARMLGDKRYFFGDRPSAVDGAGYGVLASLATRYFDSEFPDLVAAHANLSAYIGRMEQAYFPLDRWPPMG
jgi:glutathione S-transferase